MTSASNQSNYRGEDDDQVLGIKAKVNQLRFEIKQNFESGNREKVAELMKKESEMRLRLAVMLGNDSTVLFAG